MWFGYEHELRSIKVVQVVHVGHRSYTSLHLRIILLRSYPARMPGQRWSSRSSLPICQRLLQTEIAVSFARTTLRLALG